MMTTTAPRVTGGVDAHTDSHHAAALDERGRLLATAAFATTARGYEDLADWLEGHGELDRVGGESTGSYAAGLVRALHARGVCVVEVNQPHPHARHRRGKSDPIDAELAARAALSGLATAVPKSTTGVVEAIRQLAVTRDGAVKARTAALAQLADLVLTAPDELRQALACRRTLRGKATLCLRLRPDASCIGTPREATKLALKSLAQRIRALDAEVQALDEKLTLLVAATAPCTTALIGISTGHASQLLVTAGQNIDRLRSEAAFARLCAAAPVPASSGRTTRHRLDFGGDRQANRALHMIVVCRLRYCDRTRAYAARRTAEGLGKREIIRCLKRYVAREVFHALRADLAHAAHARVAAASKAPATGPPPGKGGVRCVTMA
jgi:transposase